MQSTRRISYFLKLSLPLIVLGLFSLQPVARGVTRLLQDALLAGRSGRHADAAQAYRSAYQREPWRVELLEAIGTQELEAGQVDQAVESLQNAADAGVLSLEGQYRLAGAYELLGDLEPAETVYRGLLRSEGPSARLYERLASLYRALGSFPAALDTLRAWQELDPADPRVMYLLGLHLTITSPGEAQPLLVEAARLDSRYTPTVQVLRTALSQFQQSEQPAYGWLVIGRALGSTGQWDLAEQAFLHSVDAAPEYAEAWAFLGEARYQLGRGGKTELDRAVSLAPASTTVRALTALYWRRQGEYDRALEDLRVIVEEEPEEAIWQVEMGGVLAEKGDLEAARASYEAAAALAPNQSLYWRYLAEFSARYSVEVSALGLPAARKAILLAPDDAGALDSMGQVMMALGDLVSAERFLQRAYEKDAANALVSLHLGQLYLQQSKFALARSYLEHARQLAGETPAGEIARRLLEQYFGD